MDNFICYYFEKSATDLNQVRFLIHLKKYNLGSIFNLSQAHAMLHNTLIGRSNFIHQDTIFFSLSKILSFTE